jgi:hypothetical protein
MEQVFCLAKSSRMVILFQIDENLVFFGIFHCQVLKNNLI